MVNCAQCGQDLNGHIDMAIQTPHRFHGLCFAKWATNFYKSWATYVGANASIWPIPSTSGAPLTGTPQPQGEEPDVSQASTFTLASDEEAVAQLLHARTFQSVQEGLASLRKRGYEIAKRA